MKKIQLYSVRPDEEPVVKQWAKQHPNVEVNIRHEPLTIDTVQTAKGYDGLALLQPMRIEGEELFEQLHDFGIKVLAERGTGYELYDLPTATKYGITVTNVPAYSPRSVAEMVLAKTMGLLRHLPEVNFREREHDFSYAGLEAPEIHNLTVGIVGVGKIGYTVARIFKALGATVIGNDIYHRPDVQDTLEYVDFDTLLKTADVVTMHTPLLPSTEHMITAKQFKEMKKSAIFINASRGAVVKTPDLIEALNNHEIAAAGIDVLEDEGVVFEKNFHGQKDIPNPYVDQLLAMDNVNLTPHIGFYTDMAVQNMVTIALNNVEAIVEGKDALNPVN